MSTAGPLRSGTPPSLPSPPFVYLDGIPNFRDLGGSPVGTDGKAVVRQGYVFRCGEPTKASPADIDKIRALGITHIFDLRSLPEIQKLQVSDLGVGGSGASGASGESSPPARIVDWPGVQRVFAPVFPATSYDPISLAKRYADYQDERPQGMVNAYRAILTDGGAAYGTILRHMAGHLSPHGSSLIFHCTAGKDRTGVLGALLLSLCGVADDAVATEYNLTEAGLGAWGEALIQALVRQGAPSEAHARRMIGARRDSMLDTLRMLRAEFGGPAAYFENHCGMTKDELARIVDFLVVPADV